MELLQSCELIWFKYCRKIERVDFFYFWPPWVLRLRREHIICVRYDVKVKNQKRKHVAKESRALSPSRYVNMHLLTIFFISGVKLLAFFAWISTNYVEMDLYTTATLILHFS